MTQDQTPPPTPSADEPAPIRLREPSSAPPPVPPLPPTDDPSSLGWDGIFEPGETQIWQAQPEPGVDWRDLDGQTLRAGLFPLLIGFLWIGLILSMVEPFWMKIFMACFGLPFVFKGYQTAFAAPLTLAREAASTWYTLTNQALYIASISQGERKLERFPLEQLRFEPKLIDADPGHIWFAARPSIRWFRRASGPNTQRLLTPKESEDLIGFRRIANPRAVYGLLVKARAARLAEVNPSPPKPL